MSLLKNSSATEITGRFNPINTADLLKALDTRVANKLRPVLTHNNSFTFNVKKGRFNLRNMAVVINGSAVNNIIAPTFTLALGQLDNAERSAQDILSAKNLGRLQSNVFYLSILDSNKKPFNTLSPSDIVVNIAYKGSATEIDKINVIVANLELTTIEAIAPENILMLQPAGLFDDGFIIFKMSQPGYFIAADKR